MKEPVSFLNNEGLLLKGILTFPELEGEDNVKVVIFPNGGLMGAEGDFRAYITFEKELIKAGYHVFRFNPHGIGTSEGLIEDCKQKDLFGAIESGLFVKDIQCAVDFVQRKINPSFIALSGICGGAIGSFLAAAEIDAVDCVIPISIPIVLDSEDIDYTKRMPLDQANHILSTYQKKVFSLKSWIRLFALKSDIKRIIRALYLKYTKKIRWLRIIEKEQTEINKINPYFSAAISKIINTKKEILFIFGEVDHFWWEFQELFVDNSISDDIDRYYDIYLVNEANHMLTMIEWRRDAVRFLINWIELKFFQ